MSVIIGIDPHKATHTAVAIDCDEQPIATLQVVAGRCQTERLLAWAASFGFERTWAIESAGGLGKLLAQQLVGAGEHVVDVPPTLSARVRLLGSTKAGKTDSNDALSTAIAGLRHCELRTVRVEDHTAVIRLLIDRYDGLVSLRTQATCRLHAVLRGSSPAAHQGLCRPAEPPSCCAASIPLVRSPSHRGGQCPLPLRGTGGNLLITADEDGAPFHLEFTSSAFAGTRLAVEGAFTPPVVTLPGRQLSGEVVHVGRGCPPGRPPHRREATPTSPTLPARLL
jgi:Transposase